MTIPDSDLPDFEDETTDRRLGPLSMLIILILLCSLLMPLLMPLLGEIRSFTPPQPTPTLPLRTALL